MKRLNLLLPALLLCIGTLTAQLNLTEDFADASTNTETFTIELARKICVDPTATYQVREDCDVSGGFFVDATITSLGSATSVSASDGTSDQQTSTAGTTLTFGPYTNGTNVTIIVSNDQDGSCSIVSNTLTQATCPPANDDCADAIALVCNNGSINGTTVDASDNADVLGCSIGRAVWYTFTGQGYEVTVSATGIGLDIELAVASGTCAEGFTNIGCEDSGNPEVETFVAADGVVYYVAVAHEDDTGSTTGDFNIELSCACTDPIATYQVRNDCAVSGGFYVDATIISLGSATSVSVSDGTTDLPATTDGAVVAFGPYINGTDVTIIVSNDQDGSCSVVSNTLTQANCLPVNDACADAIALTIPANTYTTVGYAFATGNDKPNVASCPGNSSAGNGVWFSINGEGGDLTITVENSGSGDDEINVFEGTCASLSCIAFIDNPEEITFPTTASTEYLIYVAPSSSSNSPSGELTIIADFSALPVELTTFTGQSFDKVNQLNWTTAREEDTDRYVVERSASGNGSWKAIGEVIAAGNSDNEVSYDLTDEQPLLTSLYRLKMMDFYGSYAYSHIVSLTNDRALIDEIAVFPVPTSGMVTVNFKTLASGRAFLSLTDLNGRTVSQRSISVTEGLQTEEINLAKVDAGVYLIRVNVDGRQLVQRMVRR